MKLVKAVLAVMLLGGLVGLYAQEPPYGQDVGGAFWFTGSEDPNDLITDVTVTAGQEFTLYLWLWLGEGVFPNDLIGGFQFPIIYDETAQTGDNKMTVVAAELDPVWSGYAAKGVNTIINRPDVPGKFMFFASFSFTGYNPAGLYPVGYITMSVLQDPPNTPDPNNWWTMDTTIYPPSNFAYIQSSISGQPGVIPAYYPMQDGHFYVHAPVGVEENTNIPTRFFLEKSKPNPFRNNTTISFGLPKKSNVSLEVYDITGRLVKTLVSGELNAGVHSVVWDGTDNAGRRVASGTYFVRMVTEGYRKVSPVILLK